MGQPEILPPLRARQPHVADEQLALLARVLDDLFAVPGTRIRFGLDALVGIIPGLGDALTGILSFVIVFAGWQRGLPRVTLWRMVANIAVDSLLGSIPVFGDLFDVAWKSNLMNYRLLQRAQTAPRRQSWFDWLALIGLVLAAALLITLPLVILALLLRKLWP